MNIGTLEVQKKILGTIWPLKVGQNHKNVQYTSLWVKFCQNNFFQKYHQYVLRSLETKFGHI